MWSFLLFFWLPSSPQNARFLSDEDKHAAVHRLRDNKVCHRSYSHEHVAETHWRDG